MNRCTNRTVMSAMFTCISDSEFAGISFKNQKDQVKIVAACNMSFDDPDDIEGGVEYVGAGALDPALANRFAIYWKKKYDARDVKSWMNFMKGETEEGKIDPIIVQWLETLSDDEILEMMSRVEKRSMENAEPSTRMIHQLSEDIKSARGKQTSKGFQKGLYNGKVIFTDVVQNQFSNLLTEISNSIPLEVKADKVSKMAKSILEEKDIWEPALVGTRTQINLFGKVQMTEGKELMDILADCNEVLSAYALNPAQVSQQYSTDDIEATISTAMSVMNGIKSLDFSVISSRKKIFEMYLGEGKFCDSFASFFDTTFGTEEDINITIDMLTDDKLIPSYIKKLSRTMGKISGDTTKIVQEFLKEIAEFQKVHGSSLPGKNYADFLTGLISLLPNKDAIEMLLDSSPKTLEVFYKKAEEMGDAWIIQLMQSYSTVITQADIDSIRQEIANSDKKEPVVSPYRTLL